MQINDVEKLEELLGSIYETYGRKRLSAGAFSHWYRSLEKFFYWQIETELNRWVDNSSTPPTPSDIRLSLKDRYVSVEKSVNTVEEKVDPELENQTNDFLKKNGLLRNEGEPNADWIKRLIRFNTGRVRYGDE